MVKDQNFPEDSFVSTIRMEKLLRCSHAQYFEETTYDPQSAEITILTEDLFSDNRLKQLERSAHIISTSALESYHSVVLGYRPKRYHL